VTTHSPEPPVSPPDERPRRPHRWRRRLRVTALVLLALLVTAELVARFYLGLGDPPLSMADPQIEYLFKPDQDCHRFDRHIRYNHYSMRSDDFPAHKSRPDELRVLVVGDSVVNGGVLTDQSELATTLLQQSLAEQLHRPVVVGNVSAGSWGPPNELAYLRRFGLFDADVVVIVLSSHDYADVPTFEPVVGVNPSYPDRKPLLALTDGFTRYLLPRLRHTAVSDPSPAANAPARPEDVAACLAAVRDMIDLARAAGAKVLVAQHLERDEPVTAPFPGHDAIAQQVRAAGLTPVELGPAFQAARDQGQSPYRDAIHPSALGQRLIAQTLLPRILTALNPATTRPVR
jgi:hypothetical protein